MRMRLSSRLSPIVVRCSVSTRFSVEKLRSAEQLVTGSVMRICSSVLTFGSEPAIRNASSTVCGRLGSADATMARQSRSSDRRLTGFCLSKVSYLEGFLLRFKKGFSWPKVVWRRLFPEGLLPGEGHLPEEASWLLPR